MVGGDYSTKFAPWLSLGCLSPRAAVAELHRYEAARGLAGSKNTYWIQWELTCRDHFRFGAAKHGAAIFLPGGLVGRAPAWRSDPALFARWRDGQTGWPLVDANMRELKATGEGGGGGMWGLLLLGEAARKIYRAWGSEYCPSPHWFFIKPV